MFYSNTPNELIKLVADGDFTAISTYCRKHGRKGRFLILKGRMQQILEAPDTLYGSDCGNHATIHNYNSIYYKGIEVKASVSFLNTGQFSRRTYVVILL